MRIKTAKWRGERPPPLHIFQKRRRQPRRCLRLFSIDRFLQNSLSNYKGFYRSLSNTGNYFRGKAVFLSDFGEESKNLFLSVGKWYAARAPPLPFLTCAHHKCQKRRKLCTRELTQFPPPPTDRAGHSARTGPGQEAPMAAPPPYSTKCPAHPGRRPPG